MKSDHLQHEVVALKLKLKEEEMMRKKAVDEQGRIAGELMKLQTEKKELQTEKNRLALKNEELNEKLVSIQQPTVSYSPLNAVCCCIVTSLCMCV